ncbi:hypothetical protein [Phenylobacterium sp.]|uniref:hypothetical protein n=1 Tax=Phenylobacterium sp. TaxID=1871053 RepID=UPI00301CDE90
MKRSLLAITIVAIVAVCGSGAAASAAPSQGQRLHGGEIPKAEGKEDAILTDQRSATTAAWATFYLGVFQALLGIVGAVVVYRTLVETRRTAVAADRSAKHAVISTERQLRAYVTIDRVDLTVERQQFGIKIHVRNGGATPAHDLGVLANIRVIHSDDPSEEMFEQMVEYPSVSVLGGQSSEAIIEMAANASTANNPEACLYVFGRIKYLDAFGGQQVTNFRFMRMPINTGRMIPSRQGNCAS